MANKTSKFYITTSIAYTNDKPHIGFVLELLQADCMARFNRLLDKDIFFLTGTDEQGIKNQRSAEKVGIPPQKFVDEISKKFSELRPLLNLCNDDFIRTTDRERHWPTTQDIWRKLVKNGDIYKKKYKGFYCYGCESFKTEKDLVEGKCPNHNRAPEIIEEENYFFRLSKYTKQILELIEKNELVVLPKAKRNEIIAFLKEGLEDVSFSRPNKSVSWAIPVPEDPEHTIYVWCDALTNYLSGIGYTTDQKKFKKYWPAEVHLIGKDIMRFHIAIWPAMLLSAGMALPKKIFVHGFITCDGQKMSKTLGNVVDPVEQVKKYGVDQVRYYLLKEIPSGDDGDYSEKILKERINSDLANVLGNLINRGLVMSEKYFEGKVPEGNIIFGKEILENSFNKVKECFENFKLNEAAVEIWSLLSEMNKYISDSKPWEIEDKKDVIYTILEHIRCAAILAWPFIPQTSEIIFEQLGLDKKDISFKNLRLGILKAGHKINRGKILFQKIQTN